MQIQAALSHAKSPGLSGARPPTPMLTSIPTTTHVDTQPHKQPHACHSIVCRQSLLLCFSVVWLLGWCGPCLSAWWLGRGGRVATLQVSQPYCGVRSEKMVRGPMPAPSPWQPDAGCRHGNAGERTHTDTPTPSLLQTHGHKSHEQCWHQARGQAAARACNGHLCCSHARYLATSHASECKCTWSQHHTSKACWSKTHQLPRTSSHIQASTPSSWSGDSPRTTFSY